MATGAGVMLGLSLYVGQLGPFLAAFAAFLLSFGATRIISVSSVAAGLTLPVAFALVDPLAWTSHLPITILCIIISILILWRHRENLRRVMEGKEPRVRWKSRSSS